MKRTEIRLSPDDLKCLMRGGSIDFEIKDGEEVRAVVTLCIERTEPRYRQPANAKQ